MVFFVLIKRSILFRPYFTIVIVAKHLFAVVYITLKHFFPAVEFVQPSIASQTMHLDLVINNSVVSKLFQVVKSRGQSGHAIICFVTKATCLYYCVFYIGKFAVD